MGCHKPIDGTINTDPERAGSTTPATSSWLTNDDDYPLRLPGLQVRAFQQWFLLFREYLLILPCTNPTSPPGAEGHKARAQNEQPGCGW